MRADQIFVDHRKAFRLGTDDKMGLDRIDEDQIGQQHFRYSQYYKGLRVEGATYIVHSKEGRAFSTNGHIVTGLDLDVRPVLTPSEALALSLAHVGADVYMWEDPDSEEMLRFETGNADATYSPEAKLIITRTNDNAEMVASNFVLTYQLEIYSRIPPSAESIYIDAVTGNVVKKGSLVYNCHPILSCSGSVIKNTTACTVHYSDQIIVSDSDATGYQLHDCSRGNGIWTWNPNGIGTICDSSNSWTDSSDNCYFSEAHWCAEMTYDYFLSQHNSNSYDGSGGRLSIRVSDDPVHSCNAQSIGQAIILGRNTPWCTANLGMHDDYFVSLDVIGHEFTHLIIQRTANLGSSGEPGALRESFCDMFGVMIEFYAQALYDPTNPGDWYMQEDILANNGTRDLCAPKANNDPDTYLGTYWGNSVYDNCGVPNKWFCLLSNGGSGVNDVSYQYNLKGLGREKAAQIAYRALTLYLTSTSNFSDTRRATADAAFELFGCDALSQVLEAWEAVGVGVIAGMPFISLSDYYDIQNYTVAADETWNTDKMIKGTITVNSATTLNINNVMMSFGSEGEIVLEPGASLIMDGATLTSICVDSMWQGITLKPRLLATPGGIPKKNSYAQLDNNSVIENAHIGIKSETPTQQPWKFSGGTLISKNSTFR
ncbi:MAG: M4 family metallopeptidase, partial [Bacteroidetes bacterium]|nr:M4 family metallopeptidase [Bacteroidota bacterium]